MTKPLEGEVLLSPSALSLITDRKLRLDEIGVFFAFVKKVETGTRVVVSVDELTERLELTPRQVKKAIQRLIKLGVLLKESEPHLLNTYHFNPTMAWKGDEEEHLKAVDAYRRTHPKDPSEISTDCPPVPLARPRSRRVLPRKS
jgi:hypothetical protein